MGAEYRAQAENKCIRLFRWWNNEQQWFSTWTPCETFAPYDVDATTKQGNCVKIELKARDVPSTQFEDYFIEADKLADGLLYASIDGCIPLYINFFTDGKVATWRLDELKNRPQKRKLHRANKGYDVNDEMPCYCLPLSEAYMSTMRRNNTEL